MCLFYHGFSIRKSEGHCQARWARFVCTGVGDEGIQSVRGVSTKSLKKDLQFRILSLHHDKEL